MKGGGEKQHEAKIHKSLLTANIRLRVFLRFDLKVVYFGWKERGSSWFLLIFI